MTTTPDKLPGLDSTTADGAAVDGIDAWGGAERDGHRPTLTDSVVDVRTCAVPADELVEEVTRLRARLDTLPTIEQAKGILMVHERIDAGAAFNLLRRWSSHTNMKLRHISRLIVDAASRDARAHLPDQPPTVGPSLDDVIAWLGEGDHRRATH